MEVQARRRGSQTYFYLTHSYRERGRIRKIEWYLGRALPRDIARIKWERRLELLSRQWTPELNRVGSSYRANLRRQPASIRAKELETFAIRFTYDTNRIEGSSLTFRETASLLTDGTTPSNRPISDVQEALAHRQVFLDALQEQRMLSLDVLLDWHKRLFGETKPRVAGQVRTYRVGISGSRYEPPTPIELDFLLTEFFGWLRSSWENLHPVMLAALVHYRLVSIHPFGDGNGRVTRLAMNYVLYRKRFPMFDIAYTGRAGYYAALERSHLRQDESVFLRWFLRRYLAEHTRKVRTRVR
jgi:Fic family protein